MKLAIWNADSFVGSNFANYFVQHSKYELCLFVSPESARRGLLHMAAALSSKSRVTLQVSGSDASGSDVADYSRLQMEKPDIVICIDNFPRFLTGKFNTVFVGKSHDVFGANRTFLYSNAFGPRQPRNDGVASAMLGIKPLGATVQSAIYIKDLFDQFYSFLEKEDKFAVASESPISENDIKLAIAGESSTKIQNAIAHTYAWYCGNPWYQTEDR
jgi:hypothetical protein